jgi:hypothetical protein
MAGYNSFNPELWSFGKSWSMRHCGAGATTPQGRIQNRRKKHLRPSA